MSTYLDLKIDIIIKKLKLSDQIMNETAITKTLYALERPTSNEQIDELNITIGKYLDGCNEKLNYSFWNTVIYTYWNFINLTKLCDAQYDSNEEDFIKKIRDIVRQRLKSSPKLPVKQVAPVYVQVHQPVIVQTVADESSESETAEQCKNKSSYIPPTDNIPDEKSQADKWFGTTISRVAGGVAAACIIFFVYRYYTNSQKY